MIDLPTAIRAKSGIPCNLDGTDSFKTVAEAYKALVQLVPEGDTLVPAATLSFSKEDAERWWAEWSAEEAARKQMAQERATKTAAIPDALDRLASEIAALSERVSALEGAR